MNVRIRKIEEGLLNGGFTLIELLVVLAIIGILAGLISTAVVKGMMTARQMRDAHNMKQVGLILIAEAMENNGVFRSGLSREDTELDGTTVDVMQGLINDGLLDDPNVLIGEGSVIPTSATITEKNVGFQYVAGHSSSSASRLPLLFTKGVAVDKAGLTSDKIGQGTSAWGTNGVGVCYVGGHALWIRAKVEGNGMKLQQRLGIGEIPDSVTIYK